MDILLALEKRTEQAEVYTVDREATEISFEANELKSAQVKETQGVAVRGIVDGRLGFSAASGQVQEEELVENLVASARFGERLDLTMPGQAPGPEVETVDPDLEAVPLEQLTEMGREVVGHILQADKDAQVSVDIERSRTHTLLRNSTGAVADQEGTAFRLSARVERVREDDVLMVYDAVADIGVGTDYQEMVDRLASKVMRAQRATSLTSGRMPVLFSPSGALVLLVPLLMAVNGQSVQRGTSPLSDRLGESLFDDQITIWDDPTLSGRPASASYDDEGVPCRRKAIVEQGVISSFLYDLKTAALMGSDSTGNGARSLFSPPTPSATNLMMDPGEASLDEMVAGIDRGLLVESVLGLGQGNPISGAFSNPVGLAFVIEDGEIVGRVKDVAIAGNIYELLKQTGGLSRERIWVHGRYLLPHILIPELNVVRS